MHWILLALGLVGTGAFCWYVLREDRRTMQAHEERRARLSLVTGGHGDGGEAQEGGVDAQDAHDEPGRRAA